MEGDKKTQTIRTISTRLVERLVFLSQTRFTGRCILRISFRNGGIGSATFLHNFNEDMMMEKKDEQRGD